MSATAIRTEVFYLNPADGWAAAAYDAEGNQIGEAMTAFHLRDAISYAQADHPDLPTHIFRRDGSLRRINQPRG